MLIMRYFFQLRYDFSYCNISSVICECTKEGLPECIAVRTSRVWGKSVQLGGNDCDFSPGLHEILDFFACPLAIIQVLDDAVISSCADDISVLISQLKYNTKKTCIYIYIRNTKANVSSSNFTIVTQLIRNLKAQARNPQSATCITNPSL